MAMAVASAARAAILFQEGFEGLGYENPGWIEVGAPDPDYASPALEGENSLRLAGIQLVRRSFAFPDSFHLYFRVAWKIWDPYNNIIDWEDVTTSTIASIYGDNDKLLLLHGRDSALGKTTILENVTYHVWLDWTRGTGSNGTMTMFLSTDGFKPAVPEAGLTNGTGTAVDRIFVGPASPGADVLFDSFLVSDQAIGDSPGANRAPTISDLADQAIDQDATLGPLSFVLGDAETAADALVVHGLSSDTALVPVAGIVFGGSGANRTVTVTPAPGAVGTATLTLVVDDGTRTARDSFVLTVESTNTPPGGEYLLVEGFEGPGYENPNWLEVGAPNPDEQAQPPAGSECLRCLGGQLIRRAFEFNSEFHVYFQVRWNTYAPFNTVVYWEDDTFSITATLYADFDHLLLIHGTQSVLGTTAIREGTNYHVWLDWTRGSGSNGEMRLFLSRNDTKPQAPEAAITNGTGQAVQRIYVGPSSPGADMVFDQFLLSTRPIGSHPEPRSNQPPHLSAIADQVVLEDTASPSIPFTVSDPETPASLLTLSVSSSDPAVVPADHLQLAGNGTDRSLMFTPATNASGSAVIALRATDPQGASVTNTFLVTVQPVLDPILVLTPLRDLVALAGRPTVLRVQASSELPIRYRWEKDGVQVPGAEEPSLGFPTIVFGDAGHFTVHLDNGDVAVRSDAALEVLGELPELRIDSIEHRGVEASIIFFTVSGASYRVEFKDAESELGWQLLQELSGSGWVEEVVDHSPAGPGRSRIYRVRAD
jgi:hypothetical protein